MVIDSIGDLSSQAKVGRAKSPGTPKLCRTPRRWRYSNRNCPMGMRAGNGPAPPLDARLTVARDGRPPPPASLRLCRCPLPPVVDDEPREMRLRVLMPCVLRV